MLWRKMFRDILGNKGSYFSCLVLISMGLIVFMAFSIVKDNLSLSKDVFYQEQNFAHGFVELVSMPESNVERLTQIEGIKNISGRIVKEVRVNDPERQESVYLKLVSLNLSEPNRVNDARLINGEALVERDNNAWVDNQFFKANNLKMGQTIEVITGNSSREIVITGEAMSPEFTYLIRNIAEFVPNPSQYGVAFIPLETMGRLFPELQGRVNDLVFTLEPGYSYESVEALLEVELEQYGLRALYPREDQISHIILSQEVEQLEALSTSFPILVLVIAGILLYIMLMRLVEQQRVQIGILKAYGYSNREVLQHYLSYALVVGLAGGILGGVLGILAAYPLTALMLEFFNVPEFLEGSPLYYFVIGLLLSLGIVLVAGYQGCKQVLKLEPAEAMRPPAPVTGKKSAIEKIEFFVEMLSVQGKMAIRNISRNWARSAFLLFGIMISFALVVFTWSLVSESMDKMVFYQYDEVETYDVEVILAQPHSRNSIQQELEDFPHVNRAEPLVDVPVNLINQWRKETVVIKGITGEGRLFNILDIDGNRITPSDQGLILSQRLADNLDVKVGDTLELESYLLRQEDQTVNVEVYAVIPQYLGMNAYMEIGGLEEILGQGKIATSFLLSFDQSAVTGEEGAIALRHRYQESQSVARIASRQDKIGQVEELMETFGAFAYSYVSIGVILSFLIIYISSFIIVSERSRELASMRVLGMTSEEVFSVISFEQWFISFFAILGGIPLAILIQTGFAASMSTDLYVIPLEISVKTLLIGIAITLFSIWVAQRFALKRVRKLSLVEVLKARD